MTKKKTAEPPKYKLTPKGAETLSLTAEQLVDIYLDQHDHWFSDPENGLYGKREESRRLLLVLLRTGEDVCKGMAEIYIFNHFQREWMEVLFKVDNRRN